MKKFLLCIVMATSMYVSHAQSLLLNELYVRPATDRNEFFELYNTGLTPAGENTDCYSIVTYFNDGTEKGVYVLDLPNQVVPAQDYFVGASANPFYYQATSTTADYSWNDQAYMAANSASTKKYVLNSSGTGYNAPVTGTFDDIFLKSAQGGGNNGVYAVFLFYSGTLVDGFLGANNNNTVPAYITDLPDLPAGSLACSANAFDFSTLNNNPALIDHVNPAAGTDNGYYRENDGRCGDWLKSASASEHTPGMTNGSKGVNAGALTYVINYNCNTGLLTVDLVSGQNVSVSVYRDNATINVLNSTDVLISGPAGLNIGSTYSVDGTVTMGDPLIVVLDAPGTCYDKIIPVKCTSQSPLPVNLKSFTATRNQSDVTLKWETLTEQNAAGFELQKQFDNGRWEAVTFIPSQAVNGNSSSLLVYTYNDLNTAKAVTNYRLRQIDVDGNVKFSPIRAVRGLSQGGSNMVYPNPTTTGAVTVLFDKNISVRDVILMDMSGRVLRQWNNVIDNTIQVTNLRQGIYNLKIMNRETGEMQNERIIVNK